MMMRISLNIHLVAKILKFSLKWVVGSELVAISGWRLNVLHVFFCFDLNHRRFSKNHNLNIIKSLVLTTLTKYYWLIHINSCLRIGYISIF